LAYKRHIRIGGLLNAFIKGTSISVSRIDPKLDARISRGSNTSASTIESCNVTAPEFARL
jgi:hypothetical protein